MKEDLAAVPILYFEDDLVFEWDNALIIDRPEAWRSPTSWSLPSPASGASRITMKVVDREWVSIHRIFR